MPNYSCEDFYSLGALKMNYYSDRYTKHRFIFRHRFEKTSYYF